MRARWLARLTVVAVVSGAVLSPTAAFAHTRTAETTNVDSRIVEDPTPDGITVRVHTGGLLIEVVNATSSTLVVRGYDGEPYLRIGPDGVEENRRSPAAWLNRARYSSVAIPPEVDAGAAPSWVVIGSKPRHIWHDHRTHWMSPQPPRFVEAAAWQRALMSMELVGPVGTAGDETGSFQPWVLELVIDGELLVVRGELVWVDPRPAWPWALIVVIAAGFAAAWRRRLLDRAAWLTMIVAASSTLHLVDDVVAFPSDPLDELFGILHTAFFLAVGLAGALWALRADEGRRLALAIGSGAVLYHQGLLHAPMLVASQFPTVWPMELVRLSIALALAQAGVAAVVLLRLHRVDRAATSLAEADLRFIH